MPKTWKWFYSHTPMKVDTYFSLYYSDNLLMTCERNYNK